MMRLTNAGSANWRLSVIDLNSTNGTTVQRWTGSGFDPARPVPPDQETHLGTRDQVILGDTVLLRLSGKRYLAEPTNPTRRCTGRPSRRTRPLSPAGSADTLE